MVGNHRFTDPINQYAVVKNLLSDVKLFSKQPQTTTFKVKNILDMKKFVPRSNIK